MTPNDPPDFKVTVLRSDETTIELALEGALYEGTLGLFDEALERHAVASRSRLVFDCGHLTFLSSAGLSRWNMVMRRRKELQQELILARVPPLIRKILRLTRIDKHLPIIDSEEPPPA